MSDLMMAGNEEKLWHKLRGDLARYAPEMTANHLLMCCACGRLLPREAFNLEHLIPQQALKRDPDVVRANTVTPKNVRAGNLLLCQKRLILKGKVASPNGCNGWKGRYYDKSISELVSGSALEPPGRITDRHIIAALSLGYLAMVAEFGYVIALMQSGLLMREQFFMVNKFHRSLALRHHFILGGPVPTSVDARMWTSPFSFSFHNMACTVGARNFAVMLPVSRDPRQPLARHLRFAPSKFKLRPDFRTVFD
jgi:hypothetical protein